TILNNYCLNSASTSQSKSLLSSSVLEITTDSPWCIASNNLGRWYRIDVVVREVRAVLHQTYVLCTALLLQRSMLRSMLPLTNSIIILYAYNLLSCRAFASRNSS